MTLISVKNKDGKRRHCGAWCYEAKSTQCHCVCGGKNHGVGEQQAIENTKQLAREREEENQLAQDLVDLAQEFISDMSM